MSELRRRRADAELAGECCRPAPRTARHSWKDDEPPCKEQGDTDKAVGRR